jgi:RNA polymerase primary sigma factor
LPANIINKISAQNKEILKFESLNEREPVFGEMLDRNNVPVSIINYPRHSSLNDVIGEDGTEFIELLVAEVEAEDKLVVDDRIKAGLDNALSLLDEREREIVESYFGLNTECETMTLEAIGERYGLTKERIRQVKNKALMKLRFNSHDLYNLINE